MLRFVPDTWLDGLLRPLLLADSAVGLYVEIHAPDLRFAFVLLLLAVVAVGHRSRKMLDGPQWRTLIGLFLALYTWTFVSGNGRYFFWGLLLAGPMVVVLAHQVRATRAMRNALIVAAMALQGGVVWMTYQPNVWALLPWREAPGLEATPLTQQPAVFLTLGTISYSLLVPHLHPQSRWTNLLGQQDLSPGSPDYRRLQDLMASPLPKYVVVRASKVFVGKDQQPLPAAALSLSTALSNTGLLAKSRQCEFVRANIADMTLSAFAKNEPHEGFWFCEVTPRPSAWIDPAPPAIVSRHEALFELIEARCPRLFPRGNARSRPADGGEARFYNQSDAVVVINDAGGVYFKHIRSVNPTELGHIDQVRLGQFEIDCERLPGRYRPPWARD